MSKTTIGMIRHGVTSWNVEKRIQGMTDIPLNEEGRRQAGLIASRINQESWDGIYSSDLSRAHETAKTIADTLKITILATDERAREKSFGEAEGTTEEERIERWGTDWKEQIQGAETDEDVFKRGSALVEEIRLRHPGERILVVSHGGWIVSMLSGLFPRLEFPFIGNTSLTVIQYQDGQWIPGLLGCQMHLE